jgi:hypothetical protein
MMKKLDVIFSRHLNTLSGFTVEVIPAPDLYFMQWEDQRWNDQNSVLIEDLHDAQPDETVFTGVDSFLDE